MNNWLSPNLLHALGWTLVHSLWQILAIAALAAVLTALFRRPTLRYIIGVCALVLMLAAPALTLFVLLKSDAAVDVAPPATLSLQAASAANEAIAAPTLALGNGMGRAMDGLSVVAVSPQGLSLQHFLPWLVGAWLCGVMLFSLRFAGGFLLLEHRRRTQCFAPDARILSLCRQVQQQLGLTRAVRYLECTWLEVPAAMGWLRPVILLPVTVLTGLDEDQLRAVIAHELAHIRRWDFQVNLFQIFAETLLFYHPALWWLNKRIRAERELCCDEIAVAVTGNRIVYARALAAMAAWKSAPALAMAANRGPLTQRILHVLGQNAFGMRQRVMGLTGGVVFLLAALAAANTLFGIAYPAHASENPKPVIASAPMPGAPAVKQAPVKHPNEDATAPARASVSSSQDAAARPSEVPIATNSSKDIPPPVPATPVLMTSNMPQIPTPEVDGLAARLGVQPRVMPDPPAAPVATPVPESARNAIISGLQSAEAPCPNNTSVTALAECLKAADQAFWESHHIPNEGALWDFATRRLDLAEGYDSGKVTKVQFVEGMAKDRDRFVVALSRIVKSNDPFAGMPNGGPDQNLGSGPPGESLDLGQHYP